MPPKPKVQTFKALYAFHADESDELELMPGDLIDVVVVHAGEWGVGTSRRTQKEGTFPWSYVELLKVSQNPHKLEAVNIVRPSYCHHCGDFIWGALGKQAYKCSECLFRCHKKCKFFVENNMALECTPIPANARGDDYSLAVEAWTTEHVRLWLSAVKLQEYEYLFMEAGVTGAVLANLTLEKLRGMGFNDDKHRGVILACVEELLRGDSKMLDFEFTQRCERARGQKFSLIAEVDLLPRAEASSDKVLVVKNHRFKLRSYVEACWCDSCRKMLFGLARQGLQCTECGYNTHKMCLDLVPQCQPRVVAMPRPTFVPKTWFGVPLESIVSGDAPPKLVLQCIASIEARGITTNGLYRFVSTAQRMTQIREDFLGSAEPNLEAYDVLLIGGLLRRFFAELPEPLIPFDLYDRFVAALLLPTEGAKVNELNTLVDLLPKYASNTLKALMTHLAKVASNAQQNGATLALISQVWAPLLLRVPDEDLVKVASNASRYGEVVELLISKCQCGGLAFKKEFSGPPPLPSGPKPNAPPPVVSRSAPQTYENVPAHLSRPSVSRQPPVKPKPPTQPLNHSAPVSSQHRHLEAYPWFAGDMDRPAAETALANLVDGAFLIRVSQSRAGYSLTVKYNEMRHIVIVESGGKFGFSEPTVFDSLPDLIAYFSKETLACYNAELETTLAYPFKTAPLQGKDQDAGLEEGPDEDVYISNVSALRESLQRRAGEFRHDFRTAASYSTRVKELQRDLHAQDEVCTLYREQKKIQEILHHTLSENDREAVMLNFQLLCSRLAEADRVYQSISRELLREKELEAQEMQQAGGGGPDMGVTSPVGSSAPPVLPRQSMHTPQRTSLTAAPPEIVPRNSVHGTVSASSSSKPSQAVPNPSTSQYYIGTVPRETAEYMLEGKPDGTYLVRHSNRPRDPFTLSLRYTNQTRHIQIKSDDTQTRFGLAEPLAFYSLDALCDYYKRESLSATICTALMRPIKDFQ